jgi:hypothetical protein
MPEAMVDAASAAAKGDHAGFQAVGEQVAALMGQSDAPLAGFAKLIDGAGLDLSSPGFQQLLTKMEEQLARDPEAVQRLSEQLFGGRDPSAEDKDE